MLNGLRNDFNKRFDQLDEKFQRKFDQLSQKLDDIYEANAISSIMNKIRADHNLETPYSPTNRIFNANFSENSKMFFDNFGKYLHKNYAHLWTEQYKPLLVSLTPQQIEFDVLGFGFEKTSEERGLIQSPNTEPVNTTSSGTYITSFNANTIICGEVTTSNISFNENDLLFLEKVSYNFFIINIFECLSNIVYSSIIIQNQKILKRDKQHSNY